MRVNGFVPVDGSGTLNVSGSLTASRFDNRIDDFGLGFRDKRAQRRSVYRTETKLVRELSTCGTKLSSLLPRFGFGGTELNSLPPRFSYLPMITVYYSLIKNFLKAFEKSDS